MSEIVVEVRDLHRHFGETHALDGVSFDVRPGCVYGLVGANGQGKTTLIKHLLGLLRAQQGTVRVFGLDPVKHAVSVLERIGYLSEHREMPEWMRVKEMMKYTAAFHQGWDQDYANRLLDVFGLPREAKIKALSKGMRAQIGLTAAVSHRPELLLLDEPSTGLDAIVRKDILNEVIRAVADDGRTAVFSSHLLDEVEQMSDDILMMDAGKLLLQGSLDSIKQDHWHTTATIADPGFQLPRIAGVLSAECHGSTWELISNGSAGPIRHSLEQLGAQVTAERNASLQEIFVARVGRTNVETAE